jgi:hypothetical protein
LNIKAENIRKIEHEFLTKMKNRKMLDHRYKLFEKKAGVAKRALPLEYY